MYVKELKNKKTKNKVQFCKVKIFTDKNFVQDVQMLPQVRGRAHVRGTTDLKALI